jgi:coiled-coil domain-containing protein 77
MDAQRTLSHVQTNDTGVPPQNRQALSDAQQFLFEERQRLLALQAENDELKLQELDDRKRMQHLLAMTQPLEQQITYRGDGLPAASTLPAAGAAGAGQQPGQAGGGGGNVMRTVFLPTANADALLLKIESLQAQLNEQVGGGAHRVCPKRAPAATSPAAATTADAAVPPPLAAAPQKPPGAVNLCTASP